MRYFIIILLFWTNFLFGQDPLLVETTIDAGTNMGSTNNNGIVIGDFDNDGFEDLFVPSRLDTNTLYKNMGDGTFQNVTMASGIEVGGLTMTGVWGDIDNDGDLDLFIGNYYTSGVPYSNYLYLNDGTGVFTDISASAGINTNDQTRSVHMVDLNLDGYLDIYVCNLLQENVLWQNNGDNTFTNNTAVSGLYDSMISMGAVFFDYDNDGDQDVYLTHDGNQANIMYENNGLGIFTDVSAATNLNVVGQGMGVDHGDINNDGHLDIYVTNLGPNFLLLNNGVGSFSEVAIQADATGTNGMGWGCFFIDYDNDGWEDIYVINDSNFSPSTNKLFKNNGNYTFTLVSFFSPLNSFYAGRGGTWGDFNNDGFPEILVANGEDFVGVQVFENQNSSNNWIGFELEGTNVSRDAFGTRVQVNTINGVKIDEKTGGSSYASQSSHRVYFGLGQGNATDIQITWPDGSVDFFDSLMVNQIHTIQQGMNSGDMDGDGFSIGIDCDDNNPNVNPDMTEIPYNGLDDDCNPMTLDDDLDNDGFTLANDCDDLNFNINPNASEIFYNGVDEDCNPMTVDDDMDGDGFALADDCNDMNSNVNPNITEVPYNGIDDDCDPMTVDDDLDGDGFLLADDCDDMNSNINPNITEVPYNGIDDDCDPMTVDDDLDGDGFLLADDCDDMNSNINPDITEVAYNGIDDDCDPLTVDDDLDGDGFLLADDCDDMNSNINPNITEVAYNGIDDDCDPITVDDDLDGDGFVLANDCDDMNPEANPNGTEVPNNGIDEDCDGVDLMVGTHELAETIINIFPNPATDYLNLDITESLNFELKIYDLTGKLLHSKINERLIHLKNYQSGIYLIEIRDLKSQQKVVERIVIE